MSGGGTSSSTQTTTSNLPANLSRQYSTLARQIGNMRGPRPVRPSNMTRQSLRGFKELARGGFGQGLTETAQDVIGRGGFNRPQNQAMRHMRETMNTDPLSNPFLSDSIDIANREATKYANMAAMNAGGFGSSDHAQNIADAVSRNTTQAMFGQYNTDQARRDAASQNLFNMGQYGLGNMSSAYGLAQMPYQAMSQIGGIQEGYKQAQQYGPYNRLAAKVGLLSGAAQPFGQSTVTSTYPNNQTPMWQRIGGNALMGYGMSGGNPMAALFGGISGAFG